MRSIRTKRPGGRQLALFRYLPPIALFFEQIKPHLQTHVGAFPKIVFVSLLANCGGRDDVVSCSFCRDQSNWHMGETFPTIHIVDDDESFRSATGELLSACGYKVSLHETAKKLLETSLSDGPGCILLDLQMGGLNGLQLQDRLRESGCRLPIVFISAYGDIPTTVQTIKAGAEDFLTKPVAKERLLETIQRALARYEAAQTHEDQISVLRSLFAQLTPREREVFDLLARGKPHKQISYELGISERTVKLHRHQVVEKLKVRSLAELAVIAERLGLLPERNDKPLPDGRQIGKKAQAVSDSARQS